MGNASYTPKNMVLVYLFLCCQYLKMELCKRVWISINFSNNYKIALKKPASCLPAYQYCSECPCPHILGSHTGLKRSSPGWMARLDGVLSHTPKSCGFDPWWGSCIGVGQQTDVPVSHINVSFSCSLLSQVNKHILR